jgi:hypothetical protein
MKTGTASIWIALAPWLLFGGAVLDLPGFGWGSPLGSLLGILLMFDPPLAIALGIAGLMKDESKAHAVIGLVIGLLTGMLFFGLFLGFCR